MTNIELDGGAILRWAAPGDEQGIIDCIVALAVYEKEPDAVENTPERLAEMLFCENPTVFAHVVEYEGRVVGIAVWYLTYSTWTGKNGIWLEDLFVHPQYRGKGYGKALLTELAKECVKRGLPRYEWWVLNWNRPSIEFYHSLGSIPMSEWTVERVDGAALDILAAT